MNQVRVRKLNNGFTKVPKDSLYFFKKYNEKENVNVPELIDTNAIYMGSYHLYGPNRIKNYRTDGWSSLLRFYKNGNVNRYSIKNDVDIHNFNFNPEFSGLRGVCYKKGKTWFIDIVSPVTEVGTMGTIQYKILEISKDSLKIERNKELIEVYVRQGIKGDSLVNYETNW